jgi:hypothetical protein
MSFSTLLDPDAKKAAADCPDTIGSIKMHPPHRHRNGDRDRRKLYSIGQARYEDTGIPLCPAFSRSIPPVFSTSFLKHCTYDIR